MHIAKPLGEGGFSFPLDKGGLRGLLAVDQQPPSPPFVKGGKNPSTYQNNLISKGEWQNDGSASRGKEL